MGFYYPGDGRVIPYDEPGKPDRTNEVARLRAEAERQREAADNHRRAGYSGAAASNSQEAVRLDEKANDLERRK